MINFDKKTSELNSMSLNEAKDIHALIPLAVPNIENDSIEVGELLSDSLSKTGDSKDNVVTFIEAAERTNIESGETHSVFFGKLKKWLSWINGLKNLACKDKADLTLDVSGVLPIANGGTNANTTSGARTNLDVYSKSEVDNALPQATSTTPSMDGTASVGSETRWAKGDHVHPTDTSREAAANKKQTVDPTSTTDFASSKAIADFVNSSIATNTANFLGTYDVVNDLRLTTSATNAQIATALGSYQFSTTPTNNDYVFASINIFATTDDDEYRRFKFNGTTWAYEYTLNNSSFTAAQIAAIDSGMTAADKSAYDAHLANTSNPHGVTKAQVGLNNVDNTSDATKKTNFTGTIASDNAGFPTGGAVYTALGNKLNNDGLLYTPGINLARQEFVSGVNTSVSTDKKSISINSLGDTYFGFVSNADIPVGTKVTISFDVEYTGSTTGWAWYFRCQGFGGDGCITVTGSGRYWTTCTITTALVKGSNAVNFFDDGDRPSVFPGTITIKNIKLELGEVPTGFSLAPADVAFSGSYDDLSNKAFYRLGLFNADNYVRDLETPDTNDTTGYAKLTVTKAAQLHSNRALVFIKNYSNNKPEIKWAPLLLVTSVYSTGISFWSANNGGDVDASLVSGCAGEILASGSYFEYDSSYLISRPFGAFIDTGDGTQSGHYDMDAYGYGAIQLSNGNTSYTLNLTATTASKASVCFELDNTSNTSDCVLTVKLGTNVLRYASSAGNVIPAGVYAQVTVLGNCWTWAEFVNPSN